MRWDDLKYLLAVADERGLAGAAKALAVDTSTVSRRIAALEEALGTELVARTPEGMTLSDAGRLAAESARTITTELANLSARIAGGRDEIAGRVRVSSTDSFAAQLLGAVAPLRALHPQLIIDLVVATETVDLRRREADVAVRFFREERDGLAMRKLGTIGWSLYASPAYLARRPTGSSFLDGHDVVGYGDEIKNAIGPRWLDEHARAESIRVRCSSPRAALDAALAGMGVALLPCYVVGHQPLTRITDQVIVAHDAFAVFLPERRSEGRLRVVIDALVAHFARAGAALAG